MKRNKEKKNRSFRNFLHFYTLFRIPWWLYFISMGCGLAGTAITLHLNQYTINFNQGELYNRILIGYAVWTLISAAVTVALNMTAEYGNEKITYRARSIVWKHILCLSMKIFHKNEPYGMVSCITNEVPQASTVISMLSSCLASAYGFIAAIIVLVQFNAEMLLYMLVLIPLAVFQFWAIGKLNFYMNKRKYTALNSMTSFFAEHLKCAKQVKAQSLEDEEINAGLKAINTQFKADLIYGLLLSVQTLINSVYQQLYTIFIAVFGSKLIREKKMTSNGILTFQTYWTAQDRYLSELLTQYQAVKGTQGALEKVNGVLLHEKEDLGNLPEQFTPCTDIVLDKVCFGYEKDREILHNISCTIPCGKHVAVIGANGCGKSTLFKLLMHLYEPDSGKIYFKGNEEPESLCTWRKRLGYVAQSTTLFSGTIRDNILYGTDGQADELSLENLCTAVSLNEVLKEKENGLDEQVGESGSRLSGGQQQRVAIARALAVNPEWLLLDEATSQLDVRNDKKIEKGIRRYMNEKGVIFIAHNIGSARKADLILLLDKGRLVDMGSDEELMSRCDLYREYVAIEEGGTSNEKVD